MKSCEICGDEFKESRGTQRYCKICGKDAKKAKLHFEKAEFLNKIHAGDLYKVEEVTCPECGKKRLTTYGRKFCSIVCSELYRMKTAKCTVCGKLLTECGNTTGRGYCSEECRSKKRLQIAIENGNYISCEYCGEKFISKNLTNKFCKKECFDSWVNEKKNSRVIPPVAPRIKKQIERKCMRCDKVFIVDYQRMGKKFCSLDCRKANEKEDQKKSQGALKLGKDLNICTVCRTSQMDCERFLSNFVYSPQGCITKEIKGKYIIISCPKFKE